MARIATAKMLVDGYDVVGTVSYAPPRMELGREML